MSYNHKYLKYKTKYLKLLYELKGGMWPCSACTFENQTDHLQCNICSTEKPHSDESSKKSSPVWNCALCTFENELQSERCKACEEPQAKASSTQSRLLRVSAAAHDPEKTFHIYTTGLGCWLETMILIEQWKLTVRKSILDNIDKSFTNIIITHYDPLSPSSKYVDIQKHNDAKKVFKETVMSSVCTADIAYKRVTASNFEDEPINLDNINRLNEDNMHPHLLIDFAHILAYLPNKQTITINSYGEKEPTKIYDHINSLYFGFLGDRIPQHIAKLKLFDMDSNGNINTYIDKLIELGYVKAYPLTDPINIIREIIIVVRKQLDQFLRTKNKSPTLIDDLNIENNLEYYEDAINMIMQNESPEELKYFLYKKIEPAFNNL